MGKKFLDGYYDIEVRTGTKKYDAVTYNKVQLGEFNELLRQINKGSFLGFCIGEDQIIIPADRIYQISRSYEYESSVGRGTSILDDDDLLDDEDLN